MGGAKLSFWSIPVTPVLDQAVEEIVAQRYVYVSKSDLVRSAVKRELERLERIKSEQATAK